eukprot:TRINITY_DN19739_c0_g1_i1.p1 TRINITY_DN19739_c0_g1~~TRINITY_DN19739_c0_g1_i1.p1  ORF type:complete len:364 (-),score=49.68 TRINITY_DN19739_c0_g1_i1:266-1357(-)
MLQASLLASCRLEGPLKRKHLWKEDEDAYSDWVGNAAFDYEVITASISVQVDRVQVCIYDLAGELLEDSSFSLEATISDLECAIQTRLRPAWDAISFLSENGDLVDKAGRLKDILRLSICQETPDILRVELMFGNEENGRPCGVRVHAWRYESGDRDFDVIERSRYTMSEFAQLCKEVSPEWQNAIMPRSFLDTWLNVRVRQKGDNDERTCYMYHSFTEVQDVRSVPVRDRYFSKLGRWRMRESTDPELFQEPDICIPDSSIPYRPRYFSTYSGRWSDGNVNVREDSSADAGRTWVLDAEKCTWTYWLSEFELDFHNASVPAKPEVGHVHRFPATADNVAFRFYFSHKGFSKFMNCWNAAKSL